MKASVRGKIGGRVAWEWSRQGEVILASEHKNLITDTGLHQFAQVGEPDMRQYFRTHCAIGEGSAAPQITDTVLGSEVMKVSTSSTSSNDVIRTDNPDGTVTLECTVTAVFVIGASYNLTEFGMLYNSVLSIRQLFMDGGTPVTLTVQNNDTVTINHTMEYTFWPSSVEAELPGPLEIEVRSRTGTLINTLVFDATIGNIDGTGLSAYYSGALPGAYTTRGRVFNVSDVAVGSRGTSGVQYTGALQAYLNDFTRKKVWTIPEALGNGDIHRFDLGHNAYGTSSYYPYRLRLFDPLTKDPTYITKEDTHTLTIELEVSWERA